jgi:small subunit ribosomal protein S9
MESVNSSIIENVVHKEPKLDKFGRAYGTGRRKVSTARVWIKPGTGKVSVNGRDMKEYFKRDTLIIHAMKALDITENRSRFDVYCTITGGGIAGQAGALRHGLGRALDNFDPTLYHVILRKAGVLTRDDRMVESKKYGRHKSRRSTQFVKR